MFLSIRSEQEPRRDDEWSHQVTSDINIADGTFLDQLEVSAELVSAKPTESNGLTKRNLSDPL